MSKFPFIALVTAMVPSMATAAGPWLVPTAVVLMQKGDAKPEQPKQAEGQSFTELLERIKKLESEVERLKNDAPAAAKPVGDNGVMTLLDIAQVGMVYLPSGQSRYVALHLIVANTGTKPVVISQDQITCDIDGETRKLEKIAPELANHGFQYKGQNYNLQSMQPEKNRTVPAGGQISFWLVFPKLAMSNTIPKCKLKLTVGEIKKEIDVNSVQRAMLGLETEKIGPRGALALMTITGSMTVFNTQALVDEMEKVASQKVARVVLRWNSDAPAPDGQILNWLQNATNLAQPRNNNELFPSLPGSLREFHLVRYSENDNASGGYRGNAGTAGRIHASAADAVGAALRTAYVALPRDELLQEIREGHPLTRAAALAYGGARLDAEHLPQIFAWVGDKDPEIQRAALQTLSHFGEPEAIEKLVFYAKRNVEPLSSTAIESLAGSRFGTAHDALLNLLKNEPPESKKRIVTVLAKYPRPVWSDVLFEFASDSRAGLNLDAVRALVAVGHPKLVDILEAGLKGSDKPLRDFCFQTMANRSDERSEKLALEATLAHLKESPPDGPMVQLLTRTKDARALPLLLEQLDKGTGDRSSVIGLLVQMGDQSVAEKLAAKYPTLQNNSEKVQILNGLRQFRHPKFREYAGAALLSNDSSLVSTAANTLMQEGSPEGEKLLIAALDKQTTSHLLHSITNALANFGTPDARAALMKAKSSNDPHKKNYATIALTQIRQRSPGFQYVSQGQQRIQMPVDPNDKEAKQQQEKDAMEFFELALQLDPQIPEAYAGRGKLYLRQEKMAEAGKDFEKAIELNPDQEDSEVVTGLALSRVVAGRFEEAIKTIEAGRKTHKNTARGLYLYNTACVYSRSMQYLQEHPELPDAAKKIQEYRKKALADLEQSIKQGFPEFDWMAKDPDFKAINNEPEFKKLLEMKPEEMPDDKKAESEE